MVRTPALKADPRLPVTEVVAPSHASEVAETIRAAASTRQAIYPFGGATHLGYGAPGRRPGIGLSLGNLSRIVDYPHRDLTITVEAGVTLATLGQHLAAQHQRLPIDVPQPRQATIGGLVATNLAGPRRLGYGTIRDYLLGFRAVDGHGTEFGSGGRVVKNAAGYDLSRLMVGSLGSLAVLTQVTLLVRPIPETSSLVVVPLSGLDEAEQLLAALVQSPTRPVAVELLAGLPWKADRVLADLPASGSLWLVAGLEGTAEEVEWSVQELKEGWCRHGAKSVEVVPQKKVAAFWERLAAFDTTEAGSNAAAILVQATVRPSQTVPLLQRLSEAAPQLSFQAHAPSGVVLAHLDSPSIAEAPALIRQTLRPAATACGGHLVVRAYPAEAALDGCDVWAPDADGYDVMCRLKYEFDPLDLLNPGRFIFPSR